jgi:hypothetical protein
MKIHLFMKEDNLFICMYGLFVLFIVSFVFPNHGGSCCNLGTTKKSSMSRGASSWFYNVSTYDGEVIEY